MPPKPATRPIQVPTNLRPILHSQHSLPPGSTRARFPAKLVKIRLPTRGQSSPGAADRRPRPACTWAAQRRTFAQMFRFWRCLPARRVIQEVSQISGLLPEGILLAADLDKTCSAALSWSREVRGLNQARIMKVSTVSGRTPRGGVNHPGFDAHLPCWEGWRHAEQVRRGDQGEGDPAVS